MWHEPFRKAEQADRQNDSTPAPSTPAPAATTHPLLQLQRALGNRALARFVNASSAPDTTRPDEALETKPTTSPTA